MYDGNHITAEMWQNMILPFLRPIQKEEKKKMVEKYLPLIKELQQPNITLEEQNSTIHLQYPMMEEYVPVVLMHGLGQSADSPAMQRLCTSVRNSYPGIHVNCLNVTDAGGWDSITTDMNQQVDNFAAAIQNDPKLQNGFHAIGFLQGNLLIRGYIERFNNPPVKKFISIAGPHEGISSCPDTWLTRIICPQSDNPYRKSLTISDYWKDDTDRKQYLEQNHFLADINNERDLKNATYRTNFMSLEQFVLIESVRDTFIYPADSEQFGFHPWGHTINGKVLSMRETLGYKEDWIGLRTLDEQGKVKQITFEGEYNQFKTDFWYKEIIPLLKPSQTNYEKLTLFVS